MLINFEYNGLVTCVKEDNALDALLLRKTLLTSNQWFLYIKCGKKMFCAHPAPALAQ